MCRLNIAYPLCARVLRHVDVDDHEISRVIEARVVRPARADTIACAAQPLLEQTARQRILLVDHDVQSALTLEFADGEPGRRLEPLPTPYQSMVRAAIHAMMSARRTYVSVETCAVARVGCRLARGFCCSSHRGLALLVLARVRRYDMNMLLGVVALGGDLGGRHLLPVVTPGAALKVDDVGYIDIAENVAERRHGIRVDHASGLGVL